jgi:hypothetical protein
LGVAMIVHSLQSWVRRKLSGPASSAEAAAGAPQVLAPTDDEAAPAAVAATAVELKKAARARLGPALAGIGEHPVIFGISLRAAAVSRKWDDVQDRLQRSIRSLAAQTDRNFHVVVCGHDEPDLSEFGDIVSWLPVAWPVPGGPKEFSNDKMKKRRWILLNLRPLVQGGVYFFTLDADDLIVDKLVDYIRSDDNRVGYYIDKGYVLDVESKSLAKLDATTRPFHKTCGSCAAFWLTPADMPQRMGDKDNFFAQLYVHTDYPETCASLGRIIRPVPFYAALYLLNHGNNNTQIKNTNASRTSSTVKNRIQHQDEYDHIMAIFPALAGLTRSAT